jgi:predicted transposase YdaD
VARTLSDTLKYLTEKLSTSLPSEEACFMKTMQEIDAIYRAEMAQAREEGREEGRQEEQRERPTLILRQLNRQVGDISIDLQNQVKALSLEQSGVLAEDLLDFSGLEDLVG